MDAYASELGNESHWDSRFLWVPLGLKTFMNPHLDSKFLWIPIGTHDFYEAITSHLVKQYLLDLEFVSVIFTKKFLTDKL